MMLVVSFIFGDFGDVSWIRHLVSLKPTVEGENLPSISGHLRMGWITTKKSNKISRNFVVPSTWNLDLQMRRPFLSHRRT